MDTDPISMKDRRILVVGASAGIGRVVAHTLSEHGAHVAFAARRVDVCREEAGRAANPAIGLECDVTNPALCEQVIHQAVDQLGGLDDVVYCAGLIAMIALVDADAGWWRRAFDTNVVGAALITRAALPHLQASTGTVAYLSSASSYPGRFWPGIGVYASTKAALNQMIDVWRSEHPEVGFARISLGPMAEGSTAPEIHDSAWPHLARWADMGVASGALSPARSAAGAVVSVLTDPSRIWDINVHPRDPARPWS